MNKALQKIHQHCKLVLLYLLFVHSSAIVWAQPSNDGCANPVVLNNLSNWCSASGQYTNVGSTPSGFAAPACWGSTNNEVWFSFTAVKGTVDITINGNTGGLGTLNQPQVALYSGACAAAISLQVCGSAPAGVNTVTVTRTGLTAGVTYLIRVDGVNNNTGTFQLCINNYDSYDGCETPFVLTDLNNWCSSAAQFTNVNATASGFGAANCWSSTNNDVWFQFTAVAPSVDITINGNTGAGGTLNQPQVALYTGACAAVISQQACGQAPAGVNTVSLYKGGLTPGTTYLIRVDGFDNNQGTFQVCINNYIPPNLPGADCSTATYLCNKNTVFNPGPVGAGADANESLGSCLAAGATAGNIETNTSWYTWTCATAGTLTFDITPGLSTDDLDWVLFTINGGNCATKTAIRCVASSCPGATGIRASALDINEPFDCTPAQDNYVSTVNMTAGTTYGLLINNFTSTAQGFSIDFGGTGTFTGPTSNFTYAPNTAPCVGTPITFTNTSTGATSYNWNFGADATPATATTVGPHTVTYSTPGTKSVTLTVTGPGGCQVLSSQNVNINAPTTPTFAALTPVCQNAAAPVLPTTSTNGINGSWSPAVSTATAGTFSYTFTPASGQCATTASNSLTVNAPTVPTFNAISPVCKGDTPPTLPTTSNNGITGTWSPAVSTATAGNFTHTFTPTSGQCAATTSLTITVTDPVVPTFSPFASVCQNDPSPTLPTTSSNGINGSWSPAVSTSTVGTSSYTFTPTTGQCATTTSQTLTVDAPVTPTFAPLSPVCQGDTPPTLPVSSTNGINGSWSPGVSTATAGTFSYTFTPSSGQCATTASISLTVNPATVPTFSALSPVCQNDPAPTLPVVSQNGINGSWSPGVSTATAGTFSYTFTPSSGQCATTATLSLIVNTPVTPTFAALNPVCKNSTPPVLPTTSQNGITGTWSPSVSTANSGTFNYTFAPSGGQCATTATISLVVEEPILPTFNPVAPVCVNDPAPVLPTTSTNGITGSWAPAVTTSSAGTKNYTFTPSGGQCATTASISISVGPPATPTFTQVSPLCEGDPAPTLPINSNEGFTGSWAPAVSTTTPGTTTYTFTPGNGQCAVEATMDIVVNPKVIPTFNPIAPICENDPAPVLPASSTNGINGGWSPSTVATTPAGTYTYTFTPTVGQCASTASLTLVVGPPATPTFTPLADVCVGQAAPSLPTTSTNGFTGSWDAAPSTSTAGTYTFNFTPNTGQCATTASLTLIVNEIPVISVPSVSTCPGVPVNMTASGADTYTWSPSTHLSSSTGSTVSANPPSTETITISGTKNGCTGTTTATVTVSGSLTIMVTPSSATLCKGESVQLTASGATDYVWTPTAGLSAGTGSQVDAQPTTTTTYQVDGNTSGCMGSTTVTITVNDPITPSFAPLNPVCQNDPGPTLPVNAQNGVTGSWQPTVSTSVPGNQVYTFTPDPGQCATTAGLSLTVNSRVVPTFAPIAAVCENDAAPTLPTTSTNGVAGSWNPGSVNTSSTGTTTYVFTPNPGVCAETTSLDITVNPKPTVSVPPVSTCPNVPVNLNASGADTYSWSPAGTLSASTGSSVTCTTNSTVTITCVGTTAGCSNSTTVTVTVSSGLTITVNPSSPQICKGNSVQLTANGASTYTWTPSSGGSPLNGATVTVSPSATETYTVDGNTSGCLGSTSVTVTVNDPIVPSFQPLNDVCVNDVAPVLSSPSSNGIAGTWIPSVNTSSAGTFTYTFTPQSGECATTASLSLTVNAPQASTFAPLTAACQGGSAPSLPTVSQEGFNGSWSGAPSTSTAGTQNFVFTPNSGQCASNGNLSFTVNPLPNVDAGNNQTVCENVQITLNGSGATSYSWSNGVTNGTPFTPNPGSTTYTLTGTDANGCQNTDQVIVSVIAAPQITATSNKMTICIGETIILNGNGGVSYTWDSGITNGSPYTPTSAGTQTYTVEGTDATGCKGTDGISIQVNALPTVNGGPDQTVCPNIEVTLSGSGATTYTWSDAVDNLPFVPNATKLYTVTGTDANGCVNTDDVLVTVTNPPQAAFEFVKEKVYTSDPTVEVKNTTIGANAFIWNFGDGSQVKTGFEPTHTYPQESASYTVTLNATSGAGCEDQTSRTIFIKEELIFWVPNSFTPDGDELNNTFQPVLTSGFDPFNFTLYIYNRWGELIFESHDATIGWDGTYHGKAVPEGVYSWQMFIQDKETDEKYKFSGNLNVMK